MSFQCHHWRRDERNPILPPGGGPFDVGCCMNPFVMRRDDSYWLFYAGADKQGRRRICLATTRIGELTNWTRHGPLFDIGAYDAFDGAWCVVPCVHRISDRWHMYYTSRSNDAGKGLQAFRGIGLAVSDDLLRWHKHPEPVLTGKGFPEWPGNTGVAGAGTINELAQPDGSIIYRMHYTLATGSPSKDLLIDQAKQAVIAHSRDGFTWTDKRVIMRPRLDADYENAAVIALNVRRTAGGYRAIYAGIGTRFGAYSICEARSDDGLNWDRGLPGENLALPPQGDGWESRMTSYPNVIEEDGRLRLFYCGNGYGATGIGTAVADKLPD